MSIHDFYSKLILGNEENSLLGSLRRLSQIEDVSQFSGGGTGTATGNWGDWPVASISQQHEGAYCPAV